MPKKLSLLQRKQHRPLKQLLLLNLQRQKLPLPQNLQKQKKLLQPKPLRLLHHQHPQPMQKSR